MVRHIQPTAAPCLPTIAQELVRVLAAVPVELHGAIPGGDLYVPTEDSPQVARLRVEAGVALRAAWADERVHQRLAVQALERARGPRRTWAEVATDTRRVYAEVGIRDRA